MRRPRPPADPVLPRSGASRVLPRTGASSADSPRGNARPARLEMQFKQITIVGVGLIGGSFALCARRTGLADVITGWDAPDVLAEACTTGVIDAVEDTFEHGEVSDADLIYLAAPIGQIENFLKTRERSLK